MTRMNRARIVVLGAAVVLALPLLEVFGGWAYVLVVSVGMFSVGLVLRLISREFRLFWWRPDRKDLVAIALLYLTVVGANRLAFVGFTTDAMVGLFLSYAVVGLLLLGVIGPVVYTVVAFSPAPVARELGFMNGDPLCSSAWCSPRFSSR